MSFLTQNKEVRDHERDPIKPGSFLTGSDRQFTEPRRLQEQGKREQEAAGKGQDENLRRLEAVRQTIHNQIDANRHDEKEQQSHLRKPRNPDEIHPLHSKNSY
ncbi:hypothetical protein ACFQBQ_14715 [Granulicella cerasi]|uniref:Uncharacterized protein n=1 Tax=Granulicella cerasi TaxID=741063 RepID=A0ABW1ZCJ0_9BACT|nr:hypothetical protein [Granulicella cerasi]